MKKTSITLLLMMCCCVMTAQNKLNFRMLDVKSGITDNYVQSIIHDKYGFMWFATCNGLNRYDGYHFKQYNTAEMGTYDNNLEWLAEDASGIIWIKAPAYYLYYNREKDKLDNDIQKPLADIGFRRKLKMMFVDEDKNIWCKDDGILFYYNFRNKKSTIFNIRHHGDLKYIVCRQGIGYALFGDGKIGRINFAKHRIDNETQIKLQTGFHPRLYLDRSFYLWMYITHGSQIECYATRLHRWINFPERKELENGATNITSVLDDGKGYVWIGTDNNGIYTIQMYTDRLAHICKEADNKFSLPSNHVTCFYKDKKDIMWIGSSKRGIAYSFLNSINFENYLFPQKPDVSAMTEDSNGNFWFGFDGEGICMRKHGSDGNVYYNTGNSNIPSDLIVCSYLDSKGRIWWGSFGGGAFYYDNGKFSKTTYNEKSCPIALPKYIRRIAEDANGNIWFASYADGLFMLDKKGTLKNYNPRNSILNNVYIADLAYRGGRYLYIATASGVYYMDITNYRLAKLSGNETKSEQQKDNYANCLYEDSRGLLWIGGRYGLIIFDPRNRKTEKIAANGLSNPYIRAITEDANKNIWVSTDHRLTHILVTHDFKKGKYEFYEIPYFEEDGIDDYTFNNFSMMTDSKGNVYAGGSGGYVIIKPRFPEDLEFSSKVIFTGLYIANKYIDADTPTNDGRIILKRNIQLLDEIDLDYTDSNFALEVSAMDYENLHKLQYYYRLSENDSWVKLEGNKIYFNKLSPGKYRLEVKVGLDNDSYSSLTIHIRPPFWLSTWACILYLAIIAFGVWYGIRQMKRKHLNTLNQQKREMEIEQQHEMDEEKMRFFTNMSHDLRTPLSLIIAPIEKLLSTIKSQDSKETLDIAYRNTLILQNEINQLLDFRKLDQRKEELSLSYGDLSTFVKETCASLHLLSQKNNIAINVRINSEKIETYFDRNKVQRILLNLLSNAIKYNTPKGSVCVTVDRVTSANGENARIQIADTGIGIKDENKKNIFERYFQENHDTKAYLGSGIGLHIVKEYTKIIGGNIVVRDNMPHGSIFTLTFPIKKREDTVSASDATEVPEHKGTSILVVDDNEDFRRFIMSCLKDLYCLYEAQDGEEALRVLTNTTVDLVISDVMMPVMDGLELCHRIKTDIRYSHIPVILLTAKSADEHIVSGLKEGADDYITKPFKTEILLLRIKKILELVKNNHERFKSIDVSPAEITISTPDEQLIKKAIKAVEENMDNTEFSVEDLSACLNMSRGHLYKKLMAITGKSPVEFIRILRIKRGRQLLDNQETSISQISYQIGYSPQLFSKYFKDEYGFPPSEYNKRKDEIDH